jgi:hypothetical protein
MRIWYYGGRGYSLNHGNKMDAADCTEYFFSFGMLFRKSKRLAVGETQVEKDLRQWGLRM